MVDHEKFRRILLREKDRLARSIEGFGARGLDRSLSESISETAVYDNHPADIGTETFEREKDFGLREDQMTTMDMVEEALGRLEGGTYGTCQRCGRPIPEKRLEAVPWTAFCVECERRLERAEARDWGRPPEEDVLPSLSDITQDDPARHVEFDLEDSWQAVARWGTSDTPADTPPAHDYDETYPGFAEDVGTVEEIEKVSDSGDDPGHGDGRRRPPEGRNKRPGP